MKYPDHIGAAQALLQQQARINELEAENMLLRSPNGDAQMLTWNQVYALFDDLPGSHPDKRLLRAILDGDYEAARQELGLDASGGGE